MDPKPEIIQEVEAALTELKKTIIKHETNIDEICALINRNRPEGDLWTVINSYPCADEEDLILMLTVIDGREYILDLPLEKLISKP